MLLMTDLSIFFPFFPCPGHAVRTHGFVCKYACLVVAVVPITLDAVLDAMGCSSDRVDISTGDYALKKGHAHRWLKLLSMHEDGFVIISSGE